MSKNWCLTFFSKASIGEISTLLKTRIKTKKMHPILEFNQLQWLKLYVEFNTQKRIETEKW